MTQWASPDIRILVSAVALATACEAGAGGAPAVHTDSAGIAIVVSSGEDRPLAWRLERLAALGGEDEGPADFYQVNIRTIAASRNGTIAVAHPPASRVELFAASGQHIRSFGRPGDGPGELRDPASIAIDDDGTIAVFDFSKGEIVRWSTDGQLLPSIRLLSVPPATFQRHIAFTDTGWVVASMGARGAGMFNHHALTWIADADSAHIAALPLPDVRLALYEQCGGGLRQPPLLHPELSFDAHDSTVVAVTSHEYRIDTFTLRTIDGGIHTATLRRSVRRDLPPRTASQEMAIAELGGDVRFHFGAPCTVPAVEVVEKRGFAEYAPWIRRVALAPDGSLWVERRAIGPHALGSIDLFNAAGVYLGTLPHDTPFPLAFPGPDLIAFAETDASDVQRLVLARIRH
jgi:hypothetical protein